MVPEELEVPRECHAARGRTCLPRRELTQFWPLVRHLAERGAQTTMMDGVTPDQICLVIIPHALHLNSHRRWALLRQTQGSHWTSLFFSVWTLRIISFLCLSLFLFSVVTVARACTRTQTTPGRGRACQAWLTPFYFPTELPTQIVVESPHLKYTVGSMTNHL